MPAMRNISKSGFFRVASGPAKRRAAQPDRFCAEESKKQMAL
jgi:hypothetical protein